MCCRGKSSGRTGVCAREMGREREGDRQRERQHGESERQPDSCPLGELGLFFELLSDSFLSSQTLPYPPLYFSQSSPMCFLWALAAGICLPACPLTPSFSLFLTLFFALCRSLEACGPYFPSSLLVSASPDLSLSLTHSHPPQVLVAWTTCPSAFRRPVHIAPADPKCPPPTRQHKPKNTRQMRICQSW